MSNLEREQVSKQQERNNNNNSKKDDNKNGEKKKKKAMEEECGNNMDTNVPYRGNWTIFLCVGNFNGYRKTLYSK